MTVLVSFNGLYAGDTAETEYDGLVKGWENAGLIRVDKPDAPKKAGSRGTRKTRPRTAQPNDQGSVTQGAGDGGPASGEPGEGFGAGGYGAFEG